MPTSNGSCSRTARCPTTSCRCSIASRPTIESSALRVTRTPASRARCANASHARRDDSWSRSTQTMCSSPMRWRFSLPRSTASRPISSSRTKITSPASACTRRTRGPGSIRSSTWNLRTSGTCARSAASGRSSSASTTDDGRRVLPRLGHGRPFQRGRPADRACAARALPLAHACRVAEPYRHAESRLRGIDARRGRRGARPPQRRRALRDRRVPCLPRRRRMVDSPPADRRSDFWRRGSGCDRGRCGCARGMRPASRLPVTSSRFEDVWTRSRRLAEARRRPSPRRRTDRAARSSMSSDHGGVGVGGDEMVRTPAGRGDRGRPYPRRSRRRRRRRLSRHTSARPSRSTRVSIERTPAHLLSR